MSLFIDFSILLLLLHISDIHFKETCQISEFTRSILFWNRFNLGVGTKFDSICVGAAFFVVVYFCAIILRPKKKRELANCRCFHRSESDFPLYWTELANIRRSTASDNLYYHSLIISEPKMSWSLLIALYFSLSLSLCLGRTFSFRIRIGCLSVTWSFRVFFMFAPINIL